MKNFDLELLLEKLKKTYAHLNDNNTTAIAVYERFLETLKK
jgi:hypothetical protein